MWCYREDSDDEDELKAGKQKTSGEANKNRGPDHGTSRLGGALRGGSSITVGISRKARLASQERCTRSAVSTSLLTFRPKSLTLS